MFGGKNRGGLCQSGSQGLKSLVMFLLHIANFYFYRYHFVQTGDKNLFSKEDNEKVTGEYLNMKFADDLRGKSSAGNDGINLYGFKPDRSGMESPESYGNEMLSRLDLLAVHEIKRPSSGIRHEATLLKIHTSVHIQFGPMAVLSSWRQSLCKSAIRKCLEGAVNPAEA